MAKKILIIDDDLGFTAITKGALENAHYQVLVAQTGTTGFEAAKKELPDLILLDFMLSDMNGTQLLKKLKGEVTTAGIPVAVLTNFGQEPVVKESLSIGAKEVFLKYQVGTEDLVNKVNSLLYGQPTAA